jgi:hypothetical protein
MHKVNEALGINKQPGNLSALTSPESGFTKNCKNTLQLVRAERLLRKFIRANPIYFYTYTFRGSQ